jgi:hypothetical protein
MFPPRNTIEIKFGLTKFESKPFSGPRNLDETFAESGTFAKSKRSRLPACSRCEGAWILLGSQQPRHCQDETESQQKEFRTHRDSPLAV